MSRLATVTLSVALGLVLGAGVGVARADGPGAAYAGEEIGTIRFLDRAQNLVVLTGGDEFYATDARMLSNLTEGELVKVDFTHDYDRSIINFIAASSRPRPDNPGALHSHLARSR